jgi:hypothetical protein
MSCDGQELGGVEEDRVKATQLTLDWKTEIAPEACLSGMSSFIFGLFRLSPLEC